MSDSTVEWVTVPEAARLLNVSDRTVYRRIKAGKLQSRDDTGQLMVAVELSDDDAPPAADDATRRDDDATAVKIATLETRLEAQERLIELLTRQNEQLNTELMAALSKIPRLEAGDQPDQPRRRWWQFWK
jgi:excisionase family DNA binding protein